MFPYVLHQMKVSSHGTVKITPYKDVLSEVECWGHASESLSTLSNMYMGATTTDTIGRVNRLINVWPTDDTPPAEGIGHMKTVQQRLSSGLSDIIAACDQEVK